MCDHYLGRLKCKAFDGWIPEDILLGKVGHDKPHKDQKNDIVFKPIQEWAKE